MLCLHWAWTALVIVPLGSRGREESPHSNGTRDLGKTGLRLFSIENSHGPWTAVSGPVKARSWVHQAVQTDRSESLCCKPGQWELGLEHVCFSSITPHLAPDPGLPSGLFTALHKTAPKRGGEGCACRHVSAKTPLCSLAFVHFLLGSALQLAL